MTTRYYTVAVAGATGAVGREMINVLEQRGFPVGALKPLASVASIGKSVAFGGTDVPVEALTASSFDDVDIALFSAGSDVSREFAPVAARAGAVVIDNSQAFRMDEDVPLVVPEVNPEDMASWRNRGIIANPNCSTIQLVVAVAPLHRRTPVIRLVVDTYQATSGAGGAAMDELSHQTDAVISQRPLECAVFPHQIAFNCIPHIDCFEENGATREELKVIRETKKIMHAPSIGLAVTAVRVPVFSGHSEAVHIEFAEDMPPDEARTILQTAPGVTVQDEPGEGRYPLAINAAGTDPVYVGRIRRDESVSHGISMWVVADNLRKGAALNAVQIAELWTAMA